jgi:hypothetical protein
LVVPVNGGNIPRKYGKNGVGHDASRRRTDGRLDTFWIVHHKFETSHQNNVSVIVFCVLPVPIHLDDLFNHLDDGIPGNV